MAQSKIGDPVVKIDSDAHGTVINVRSGRGRVRLVRNMQRQS